MPLQQQDFSLCKGEDGILVISMTPPVPIGGWPIEWSASVAFGGTAFVTKSCASGYHGVSGITIQNSGAGIFQVRINSVDTSGVEFGAYAQKCLRTQSGFQTEIENGFWNITP